MLLLSSTPLETITNAALGSSHTKGRKDFDQHKSTHLQHAASVCRRSGRCPRLGHGDTNDCRAGYSNLVCSARSVTGNLRKGGRGRNRNLLGECGSALVETVFVIAFVTGLFVGVIQIALFTFVKSAVTNAALEGARASALADSDARRGVYRATEILHSTVGALNPSRARTQFVGQNISLSVGIPVALTSLINGTHDASATLSAPSERILLDLR